MSMRHLLRQASLERRIKHYSNFHQILLVGEGDFSFSSALAKAFGSTENMVCTSLDSRGKVLSSYSSAPENLEHLKRCGATVVHGVDATLMNKLEVLRTRMFGFYRNEWDETEIKKHSRLVEMFFKNARTMLNKTGEIHVTHKEGEPYSEWKLVEQAQKSGLDFKESVEFHIEDYPGYVNRRGAERKIEETFHLGESRTYMSILCSAFRNSFHKNSKEKKSVAMPKKLEKICSKSHPNSLKAVALQLESVAENARLDLEASFSQLMTLADEALDERDEFRRHRDNALQEKENIAKQLAEALKLKEDEAMQRDLSILELESERKARIDADSPRYETLKERDEIQRQKDEALLEKAKVARQLAEALRLKEDAINQRDLSMLNHKLERQARKAAEKAAEIAKKQARKAVESEKAYSEDLHNRAWKDKINAPRRKK